MTTKQDGVKIFSIMDRLVATEDKEIQIIIENKST